MSVRETLERLRDTRAVRIVLVYTATAWGIFEVLDKTVRTFGWPDAIPRGFLILLVAGLVFVSLAAWAYAGQEIGDRTGWRWPGRIQRMLAHRWFARAAIAGILVAIGLWTWGWLRPDVGYAAYTLRELRDRREAPRLVVLPVPSTEARLEPERRSLTRLLTTDLNDVDGLRTIREDRVARDWDAEPPVTPRTAIRFARGLGAHFVVVPTVEPGAEGLRVSAEILEAGRGGSYGVVVAEGRAADLPGISDRLAMQVYRELVANGVDASLAGPIRSRTQSMRAYKEFLRGESAFRRGDFSGAVAAYGRATLADSAFAMAWFRQGQALRWDDPAGGPPLASFDRAMAHAERLGDDDRELLRASGALEWGMLESVSALAAVVARRPEDSHALFLLADAEAWAGPSLVLDPDSVASTLERAAASDPAFVPTRLIAVPIAILRGTDRAELAGQIDSLAVAGADPAIVARLRLLDELAFGTVDPSDLAREPIHVLWWLADALGGPRHLAAQASVLEEVRGRADRADPRGAKRVLYYNLLARGLHSDALALIDDPGMIGFLPEASYRTIQRGLELPAELVTAATTVRDPQGGPTTLFYGGALAVDQGRWGDVEYAVGRLLEESRVFEQEGDGFSAREHSVVAGVLDQYARIRSGPEPTREAVAELEARRILGTGSSEWARMVDATARWWLADLWLELGEPERAVRYLRSLWRDPAAAERLAAIGDTS